ncbi:hypothetical protein LZ31DRAFT_592921 [Colletotrichum somersetense]|nr:hypothetical protein LZ31DRAFT_592921 [Colletotrichum somersetense]
MAVLEPPQWNNSIQLAYPGVKNTALEAAYKLGYAKTVTLYTFSPDTAQLTVARVRPFAAKSWAEIKLDADISIVPGGGSADAKFTAVTPSLVQFTISRV